MNFKHCKIILSAFIILYLIFAFFINRQLPVADELRFLHCVKSINQKGFLLALDNERFLYAHPPLSAYFFALTYRLFNFLDIITASRLFGVICFFISLLLIYLITTDIAGKSKDSRYIGIIAASLFAINPLVVRGSLLLSIDTTILNVALLGFIYYFMKALFSRYTAKYIILGILFYLSLSAKMTTALVLIAAPALFFLINKEFKKARLHFLLISAIGFTVFFISWALYSYFLKAPFMAPFEYLFKWPFVVISSQGSMPRTLIMALRAVLKLVLYNTAFFALLAAQAIFKRYKKYKAAKKIEKLDFLIIYALLILIGYVIFGRLNYGFPQYQFPIAAALSIVIAFYIYSDLTKIDLKKSLAIGAMLIFYYLFLTGDLLYISDYKFKEALIFNNNVLSVIFEFAFKSILYIFPLFILVLVFKKSFALKQAVLLSLVLSCASASIGFNIIQAKSRYLTAYYYGDKGLKEVLVFLKNNAKDTDEILAPSEVIYYFSENKTYVFTLRDILRELSGQSFVDRVRQKNIRFVIAGIGANSVEHFRYVFNSPLAQEELKKNFTYKEIGSYSIWIRKG